MAWSFFPTAIILLAVALVTFDAYQQVTEDLVIGRNREVTRLAASQLASELKEHTSLLTDLSRAAYMYEQDPSLQGIALREARDRLVVFDAGVVVLDSRGVLSVAEPARPENVGQDWSNHSYFQQMLRSRTAVFSDIVADGPGGAEVIAVAVPIIGRQGEFAGTVVGMFRLGATSVSAFYGGIVKLRVGEGGGTYLVDSAGRVIYHSDSRRIGTDISVQPAVRQVMSRKVGDLQTSGVDGGDIIASFAPVPDTPWGLVIEEKLSNLTGSSEGYRQFLLVLLALGVLVPALVVTVAVRRITGPISELIGGAKEVAGGNFGRTISVNTGDELEELARQFNMMSAQLQQSYAELEQRVADRTKELAIINAITAVASRSLDLEEIMYDALEKTLEVMNLEAGGAYRLEGDGQTLTMMAHRGFSDAFVDHTWVPPVIANETERVPMLDWPVVVRTSDYPDGELKDCLEREGLKLVVSIPLAAKGRMLGMMCLCTHTVRLFSNEEMSLLAAIGQQVGVAVENARLYREAETAAVAAERSRLARDLHDAVSQTLFSASLIAEVLPRLWERNPDEGRRRLEELRQLTRGALAEMRTLLLELRPSALVEASLTDLLRQLAEAIMGRARVPVVVTVDGEAQLSVEVKIAFYRIAQEALNNVAKHSGASAAWVDLRLGEEAVEMVVRDDGRGFNIGSVSSAHLGLGIMRERAEAIGAELVIESELGRGTKIEVRWPESGGKESER